MKPLLIFLMSIVGLSSTQETEPELLIDAPDGWRFERLDFPLEFAPDLKLEGFEELRFAPGMFDPESESYFSYALAMQIDNREEVDLEFVQDLFQEYFTGLCGAVAESRDLTLDLSQIATSVKVQDETWFVTVSMFDAFGSGQPLILNLRVTRHDSKSDKGLVLLGLASPAESTAEIWTQLDQFRAEWK